MVTQSVSIYVKPGEATVQPQSKVHGRIVTTRVVGVTFEDRQEVIARLHIGDLLWLEQEPGNLYDPHAIMVTRNNGEQIGYLNRHLAAILSPCFVKYGKPLIGRVRLLTGSSFDGYSLGVIISIKIPKLTQTHTNHRKHQFLDWTED